MTSAAQLGYRIALLVTDAAIIAAAERIGWQLSYTVMAVLMGVGVIATYFAFEPARADAVLHSKPPLWTRRGLLDALIGPFVDFFRNPILWRDIERGLLLQLVYVAVMLGAAWAYFTTKDIKS